MTKLATEVASKRVRNPNLGAMSKISWGGGGRMRARRQEILCTSREELGEDSCESFTCLLLARVFVVPLASRVFNTRLATTGFDGEKLKRV